MFRQFCRRYTHKEVTVIITLLRPHAHLEHIHSADFASSPLALLVQSAALGGLNANFNLFLPGNASEGSKVPLLTYLSGLTCTEDNA